jgi:hypothetical protein
MTDDRQQQLSAVSNQVSAVWISNCGFPIWDWKSAAHVQNQNPQLQIRNTPADSGLLTADSSLAYRVDFAAALPVLSTTREIDQRGEPASESLRP